MTTRNLFAASVRLLLLAIVAAIAMPLTAQDEGKNVRDYETAARTAFQTKDYPLFLENMEKARALQADHPRLLHNLAIAYTLNGRPDEALRCLRALAAMGLAYRVEQNDAFASLRERPEFKEIAQEMAKNRQPQVRSRPEFTVHDKGIIPESVAYDAKTHRYYLSSVYRREILRVNADGTVTEFAGERAGLWSVLGMKIDARRRLLWACTAAQPQMRGFRTEENGLSGIFKFDLDSGKLLKRYMLANHPDRHLLGDLALGRHGEVFTTDSIAPVLYRIRPDVDELETFMSGAPFVNLQGLDFTPDGKRLIVADYSRGLFVIDLASKGLTQLPPPANVTLLGIDGLYWYRGGLVAVQNGVNPPRAVRIVLSHDLGSIAEFHVLEANNPLFDEPTLGFVRGDDFYFIADSQWGAVDDKGQLAASDKLLQPVILKLPLSH